LNVDLVQTVERLPKPGETLSGGDLLVFPGGKGANQACAAGRLGADAIMIGELGDDRFAEGLRSSLRSSGVNDRCVGTSVRATGAACVLVLPDGENAIVISPGANAHLTRESVLDRMRDLYPSAVLCQLEIPLEATGAALSMGRAAGAKTILDPAPARELPGSLLRLADFVTPNQHEAAALLGLPDRTVAHYQDAAELARALLRLGPSVVVMKLGELGCLVAREGRYDPVPAFAVQAVDTTAAGDTFNGAFAVALTEGKPLIEAAIFANAAAAISVTRAGAQSSIPSRVEVDDFLASRMPAATGS
jgi:ribokinase